MLGKFPFFLLERFFLFPWIISLLSKIFFEMISLFFFFLWTGTIFLIALYLQIFSPAIVFEFATDVVNFGKKFPLIAELFQGNEHILINFSQGGLLQSYFWRFIMRRVSSPNSSRRELRKVRLALTSSIPLKE